MRVFVAGATGVLGVPVVRRLVARGDEVVGLTRSDAGAEALAALGAEATLADARDAPALRAAVIAARPDAVVHLLTALAGRTLRTAADLAPTNLLRTEATRTLLDAASSAGARRFVAESMIFVYGYGDHGPHPLAEQAPVAGAVEGAETRAAFEGLRSLEAQVMEATRAWRVEGVVLRFGILYGPGASDGAVAALRRRAFPLPRSGPAILSVVHVDDAADAVLLALDRARPGEVYNVAEDEPAPLRELYAALARAAGAPAPRLLPRFIARRLAPYGAALFETRLVASSGRAREALGWTPRHGWRESIAGDVGAAPTHPA